MHGALSAFLLIIALTAQGLGDCMGGSAFGKTPSSAHLPRHLRNSHGAQTEDDPRPGKSLLQEQNLGMNGACFHTVCQNPSRCSKLT